MGAALEYVATGLLETVSFLGGLLALATLLWFVLGLLLRLQRQRVTSNLLPNEIAEARSYRIAVIGEPAAGKSTLTTAILESLHSHRYSGNAFLRGDDAIQKYEENLSRIRECKPVAETSSDSLVIYDFLYQVPKTQFEVLFDGAFLGQSERNNIYEVQIGDYAGSYTRLAVERANRSDRPSLQNDSVISNLGTQHSASFESVLRTSHALIFVLDGALFQRNDNTELVRILTAYELLWNNLVRTMVHYGSLSGRRIVFAITKTDLNFRTRNKNSAGRVRPGTRTRSHELVDVDSEEFREWEAEYRTHATQKVRDLMELILKSGAQTKLVFTGAYTKGAGGRFGIGHVVEACLPQARLRKIPMA
jgi:GTPase SAR1 family protein